MGDIWTRRARAEKWHTIGEAIGGCLGTIIAIALIVGACGGLLFLVVRIIRLGWGG